MVSNGFRLDDGSWNTNPTRAPCRDCRTAREAPITCVPARVDDPSTYELGAWNNPVADSTDSDLPEPLSPTMPRVSPLATAKSMPCTISRGPTPTTSCETEKTGSVRRSSSCAAVSDVACAASVVAAFVLRVAGRRPALPRFRNRVRCRGSRTSRTPSPSRLKAKTVTRIARPGNTPIHQAVVRKPCAS
ncbi:Uncharacterised protein [Mycobacteroides abscessus subsp. abscessus]|nr:Uncharacterised protein [Mycobacteroides abscessus subsp. abscessus]